MDMTMMTMGWPMMLLMMTGTALLIVGLVAAVVWIVRASTRRPHDGHVAPSAIEQLGTRYARGEIDREEYLLKASDLADRAG